MTMPKGFATRKNYNYCTKCNHIEQDHTRVMQITKGTMPKGMNLPESMIRTWTTACKLCDCEKFVDKEMLKSTQQELQREQLRNSPQYSTRPRGEIADKAAAGLLIGSLIAGISITIVGVIVLHIGAIIFGLVLFFIPIIISAVAGGRGNGSGRGHNDYDAFFMNRWGSYQAKKNIRRGYRWSKK